MDQVTFTSGVMAGVGIRERHGEGGREGVLQQSFPKLRRANNGDCTWGTLESPRGAQRLAWAP